YVLCLLMIGLYARQMAVAEEQARYASTSREQLQQQLSAAQAELAAARDVTTAREAATARKAAIAAPASLRYEGGEELRQRLAADLLKHPELIPQAGVLGGTMRFYDGGEFQPIGSRWVLAPFEDGHASGLALLQYEVAQSGEISWKLLDSS